MESLPPTLIDLLSNSLILRQTAPYVPSAGLLALASTSKSLRNITYNTPEAFRYLDLTTIRSAFIDSSPIDVGGVSWRAERMDESLTEDDFYAGPLRGIFSKLNRNHVLRNVQTMILDGLSVPADLVREIIAEDRYNVKVLSIREAKNLNQSKLQHVLRYAARPSRPEGTPKLKALYLFGPKDTPLSSQPSRMSSRPLGNSHSSQGVMSSEGAQIGAEWNYKSSEALGSLLGQPEDRWYRASGKDVIKRPATGWPETLRACEGIIAFDAILCRGPRHDITKTSSKDFLQPTIATVSLGPNGCDSCGSCPEGPAVFASSPEHFLPLLSPPPLHASTVRAAQRPGTDGSDFPKLFVRCEDCLRGRWCERWVKS